ncbi:MAG: hydrolase [Clostridia bacterium]|nr:hydrolase [Clostridia bacterium]MDY6183936.1 hydrolase [Eubacteriales bacterium]
MTNREKFIDIFTTHIHREGASDLLAYLTGANSDFFTAPASTRYHLACEGGLVDHSIHVYECLKDYLERNKVKDEFGLSYSDETIAIVSLLHDLCKVNVYKVSTRNVKDSVTGQWKQVPYYEFDDNLPYGHGEKSVYVISGFMRLTREEAFAIRYHMGFSNEDDARNVGRAFELFPLALALSIADTEATYFIEAKNEAN